MRVGLVINLDKERAVGLAIDLIPWLRERGVDILLEPDAAKKLGEECFLSWGSEVDLALVLGGDGTLLRAARELAPLKVPLLGVNLGEMGFLTELEPVDIYLGLTRVLQKDYLLEERSMLLASVTRDGKEVYHSYALNDFVVSKGALARMVRLTLNVGNQQVASYTADGLIISSPTGSTAYSLSAGGPIVSPDVNVMLLTPICPHTFNNRPLVISMEQEIMVKLCSETSEVMFTVDGQKGFPLGYGDLITVTGAPIRALLVRLKGRTFYQVLQSKLQGSGVLVEARE